jgi:hypothetical protein
MKILLPLLMISGAFLLGQQSMWLAYDPDDMERVAKDLAAEAHYLGCMRGGLTKQACMSLTAQYLNVLEGIRRASGR